MSRTPHSSSPSSLSRRSFLHAAGAASLASIAAPYVRAQDKSGLARPILGSGEHRYECVHDWLVPPTGLMWGDTHGLAQDNAGRIYVAHTVHAESAKPHAVAVFDRDGTFITAWGEDFRGGAHGLDVRAESQGEFLYHCDTRRRIMVKTDLEGRVVWQAEYPKESGVYESKEKYCPTNVCFLPDGDLLVGDGYGSSYIHRYTPDGRYVRTVAMPGSEQGRVACPHGLWIDARDGAPKLAVADRGNRRIQYFTMDGVPISIVTEGIRMPCHFKTRGDLLLVPDLESVVTILDKENKIVVQIGDGHPSNLRGQPRDKFIAGKFIHPHTAIWLDTGDILVAEWVPIGRITRLRRV